MANKKNENRIPEAIKKYSGQFETDVELMDALAVDQSNYSQDEIDEIIEAVFPPNTSAPKTVELKRKTTKIEYVVARVLRNTSTVDEKTEDRTTTFELIKEIRKVKLTPEQVEILNHGPLVEPSNKDFEIICLPGLPLPYVVHPKDHPEKAYVVYPEKTLENV